MISLIGDSGDPEEHFKRLDFRGLSFPSDGLSIGVVRKLHAELFDLGFSQSRGRTQPQFFLSAENAGHVADVLGNVLFIERLLATAAFARALGISEPHADIDDYKQELAVLYERYGLAKGEHHAEELIRDIERQGAALAKGKSP